MLCEDKTHTTDTTDKFSCQAPKLSHTSSGLSTNENEPQQRNSPTGEHHSERHITDTR